MTNIIKGKEIKGYNYADGVHWHWGDMEIAVIDQATSEIEWCVKKYSLPEEVIQAIRNRRPKVAGKWLIEAKRISYSATQGAVQIQINGEPLIMFGDDKILTENGWESKIPDGELGRLVCNAFWHPMDNLYHYSDMAKKIFYQGTDTDNTTIPINKSTAISVPVPIQVCLFERESDRGFTPWEILRMFSELGNKEVIPIEFCAEKHNCCAKGFITAECAESINYDYGNIATYIADILDDMEREHKDGLYEFQGITIKLTR